MREYKSKKIKVRLNRMTVKNEKKDDSVRFVSKDERLKLFRLKTIFLSMALNSLSCSPPS